MTANTMSMHDVEVFTLACIHADNVGPAMNIIQREIKSELQKRVDDRDIAKMGKLVILHKALSLYYNGAADPAILEGIGEFITIDAVKYEYVWKMLSLNEAIEISKL